MKKQFSHWKTNFFTGLAVVLPALLSIAIVVWLFGTVANPTTGFLVLVPQSQVVKLDMAVADGSKFIMSLGAVAPDYVPPGLVARSPVPPGLAGNAAVVGFNSNGTIVAIP